MSNRPNPLRQIAQNLYGVWFGAVFTLLSLSTLSLVTVMPGEKRRRGIARGGARLVFRLTGAWPRIQGLEHLPEEASVVVANHASYLDGILLTAVLPHRYRFVIKREITQVPVVNFFLNRIGAHFVERFDTQRSANDARRIIQSTREEDSLAFFPEGTFRTEPGLRRFHSGAFTIAVRGNMPLIPLTIRGTRDMLPADRWLPALARLEIIINEAVLTDETRDSRDMLNHCREQILNALNEPDLMESDP